MTYIQTFNAYTSKLMLQGHYHTKSLYDINHRDTNYCILQILPPPPRGASTDHDAHILDNQCVQQEAFLGQKRKNNTTTFIKAPCTLLYHMCRVVANDEMFARFRFTFDAKTEEKFRCIPSYLEW